MTDDDRTTDDMTTDNPAGGAAPTLGADNPPPPEHTGGRLTLIIALFDLLVPLVLYYVLRGVGYSEITSLIATSIPPIISYIIQAVVLKKKDGFAVLILVFLIISILLALTTKDARALLTRDAWMTSFGGIYFLASVRWAKRPTAFSIARPLLEGRYGKPGMMNWDTIWENYPAFRRIWTTITVIWGVGLLVDAAIRIVLAYTLPVDVVVGTNSSQYFAWFFVMQVITNVYLRRGRKKLPPEFEFQRRRRAAAAS
ncbi:VC0807 family protein [Nocardia terpenica]|uniref:DUF3159 domain-containing protein n=1 Tax=Nocardia terpenica TaxID=455432 RepID=A0A291RFW3_9NOCA|nr:VC0807 family protein [Nocardia terpenica]ATL66190.1 hypothetical protein CRH09_08255 [Nocardia terpenica]